MSRNIRTFIAMALPLLAFAIGPSAAQAQSFTGNYPVFETQVKGGIAGNIKGAKVVGPLPGHLHNANTYTGSVHAKAVQAEGAQAVLRFLTDPAKRERWTAAGLEPAF